MTDRLEPGIWKATAPEDAEARPTVFLDRDGVIVEDAHYLSDPRDARLIPGAAEALARLATAGFRLVCLTNQSGIGRGRYELLDFAAVQRRIDDLLERRGVALDALYYCPHDPDDRCGCRKPAPGMLEAAARTAAWDPGACWFVGDKISDVRLGADAGFTPVLVRTGHGAEAARGPLPEGTRVVDDLAAAADLILVEGAP